jgi:hypothetical protein
VIAMVDAWVIVDNVHRLAGLLRQLPGGPKRSRNPVFRRFGKNCEVIHRLRNAVQHLNHEMDQILAGSWPAWGGLSWITQAGDAGWHVYSFVPGSLRKGQKCRATAPLPQSVEIPVGRVTLIFGEIFVDLGDVIQSVCEVVRDLEAQLAPQFKGYPTVAADLLLQMTVGPPSTGSQQPAVNAATK